MNVPLAAHRLLTQPPTCVRDRSEQQEAFAKFRGIAHLAHVHRNSIHGIWPRAIRIAQALANIVEFAHLRWWTEDAFPKIEGQAIGAQTNIQPGVEVCIDRLVTRRQ